MWSKFVRQTKSKWNHQGWWGTTAILGTTLVSGVNTDFELNIPSFYDVSNHLKSVKYSQKNSMFESDDYNEVTTKFKKWFNDDMERETTKHMEVLMKNIGNYKDNIIVDLGVGMGYFTEELSKKVGPHGLYIGIDINTAFVYYVNDKYQYYPNIKIGLNTEDSLCLPSHLNNHVDLIFTALVLHHVSEPDKILSQCYHLLKPNGKMIIIEFSHKGKHKIEQKFAEKMKKQHKHDNGSHQHKHPKFDETDLKRIMSDQGFVFHRNILDDTFEDFIIVEYRKPNFL